MLMCPPFCSLLYYLVEFFSDKLTALVVLIGSMSQTYTYIWAEFLKWRTVLWGQLGSHIGLQMPELRGKGEL